MLYRIHTKRFCYDCNTKKMNRIFFVWNLMNLCYQVSSSACIFFRILFFFVALLFSPLLPSISLCKDRARKNNIQQAEKSSSSEMGLTYSFTAFFVFVVLVFVFVFSFVSCLILFCFILLLRFYTRTQDI